MSAQSCQSNEGRWSQLGVSVCVPISDVHTPCPHDLRPLRQTEHETTRATREKQPHLEYEIRALSSKLLVRQ